MRTNKYKNIHSEDCVAIKHVIKHPLNRHIIDKFMDNESFYKNGRKEEYINIYKSVENNDVDTVREWFDSIKNHPNDIIPNRYYIKNEWRMALVIKSLLKAILDDHMEMALILCDNDQPFSIIKPSNNSYSFILPGIRKYINFVKPISNLPIIPIINKLDINNPSFEHHRRKIIIYIKSCSWRCYS